MSLTRELERLQLGLVQPSTFRESVLGQRIFTLRASLYREVVTTWDSNSRQELSRGEDIDNDRLRCSYRCIDIEKTEARYLLAGCSDGSLEIFDLDPVSQSPKQSCRRIAAIKRPSRACHESHCNWVQWYPRDNGVFVSSGHDKTVKVWDANEMTVVETFRFDMPVFMHHLPGHSANGVPHTLIAVGSQESNVRLADLRTGGQMQHLHGHHKTGVLCVQWSPYDSNLLLSADRNGDVFLWDVRSGKSFLSALCPPADQRAHRAPVVAMKYALPKESFRLASLDANGNVRIWDALTLKLLAETSVDPAHSNSVAATQPTGIDFACHSWSRTRGGVLFVPANDDVDMISVSDCSHIQQLSAHFLRVMSCAYRSSDHQELYTAGVDKTIGCFRPSSDDNPEFTFDEVAGRQSDPVDLTRDDWSD